MNIHILIVAAIVLSGCSSKAVRCDGKLSVINAPAPAVVSGDPSTSDVSKPKESP